MHTVKLNIRRDSVDEYVYGPLRAPVAYTNGTNATLRAAHDHATVSVSNSVAELHLEVYEGGRAVRFVWITSAESGNDGALEVTTTTRWSDGAPETVTKVARVRRIGLIAPDPIQDHTRAVYAPEPIRGEQQGFTRRRLITAASLATSTILNLHGDRMVELAHAAEDAAAAA